jgi:hypothetical protein
MIVYNIPDIIESGAIVEPSESKTDKRAQLERCLSWDF